MTLVLSLDEPEGGPWNVIGDPHRLSQILTNLISNAAKFTEKGKIALGAHAHPLDDGRLAVEFSVADTGIGMSPETVQRLFQPFMQADSSTTRRFGGTGLGLPITKQLIEGMAGKLSVKSILGSGTTFSWYGCLSSDLARTVSMVIFIHLNLLTYDPQLN